MLIILAIMIISIFPAIITKYLLIALMKFHYDVCEDSRYYGPPDCISYHNNVVSTSNLVCKSRQQHECLNKVNIIH